MSFELPTRAQVLRDAWPLVFANASIPLAGVVDTFVLGLRGDATDIGGVAIGATVFNIFAFSFYFLRMSTTALAAHADGAGERDEVQLVVLRAALLGLVAGAAILLLRGPIADLGLWILAAEDNVNAKGDLYLGMRAFGAPAAFAYFALTGWLIGTGRMVETLWVAGVVGGVNIVLDLVFVLWLGQGPEGVGLATALAEFAGLAVGVWFVLSAVRRSGGWSSSVREIRVLADAGAMRRLFDVNLALMIRTWMMILGYTWFVNSGARQGTAELAGNHVLLQIAVICAFVLDAFAFVAEKETGRAFGRRSAEALTLTLRITMELALAAGAALALATFLLGPSILYLLVADDIAREAALAFLPYAAVIPLIGAPSWVLDGIFIGSTKGAMIRNAAIFAVAFYIAADLALAPLFGNHGVWLAFLTFYGSRAAGLIYYYPSLRARIAA